MVAHSFSAGIRRICLNLIPALLLSCAGAKASLQVGGPCDYEHFQGVARFTELKSTPAGMEAHFDFHPSDPAAPTHFRFKSGNGDRVLRMISGGLPASEWLMMKGISVGVEVPAVYQEERKGTCTPWFYAFPNMPDLHGQ